jgi:hypothetical protein
MLRHRHARAMRRHAPRLPHRSGVERVKTNAWQAVEACQLRSGTEQRLNVKMGLEILLQRLTDFYAAWCTRQRG